MVEDAEEPERAPGVPVLAGELTTGYTRRFSV